MKVGRSGPVPGIGDVDPSPAGSTDFELRQLRQFVEIASSGSYRRAADQLFVAQPALSVSIRKLETAIGARLFDRGPRGVTLTAAGEALLPEARQALMHAEQGRRRARLVALGEWGVLRLGFVGSATYALLPGRLPVFRARHPDVRLELVEGSTVEVIEMVREGRADLGVVRGPVDDVSGVDLALAESDEFVAVVPASHWSAGRRRLRLSDLREEPFVMYPTTGVPGLRSVAMQVCREAGFVPRVGQEATQVQTVVSLVASGLGVALVPGVASAYANDRVRFIRLSGVNTAGRIGLSVVARPDMTMPAARLRDALLGVDRPAQEGPVGGADGRSIA